jgi:hypothetical protein
MDWHRAAVTSKFEALSGGGTVDPLQLVYACRAGGASADLSSA